ncbi:PIR protein [Plasmodium vivax]|uniref:VIR protein n=1 Tax=Plasmodium vivax TaxID=5855 RepID=A0A564ZQC2_PLAVI|nr:PIR protein [Plasmodium vivax]
MSEPNIDYYVGDDKDKIKELLKTATLYKLYNTLEQELENIPDKITCNEQCGAKLNGGSSEVSELLKLCKVICNIFLNVIDNNGFYKGSSCSSSYIYMNIWLYEHVEKIKAQNDQINNFYEALYSIWQRRKSVLERCPIINFNKNKNGFLDMKYLCEFLDIYYDIKDKISGNYNLDDQLYCKYIKKFFQYYNEIKVNCNTTPKPIFCTMIDKIKTTFTTTDYIKTIYDKCKYEATSCNNNIVATSDIPCLKDISIIPAGSGDKKYILKIINTASLSVIPVFVLLLILYKFTPLGVYIRSRIGRKKNIHNHVGQENYDLLKYTSNVEEISPDNRRYNVMYQ